MTTSVVLYPHIHHVGIELIQLQYFAIIQLHLFSVTAAQISTLFGEFIHSTNSYLVTLSVPGTEGIVEKTNDKVLLLCSLL